MTKKRPPRRNSKGEPGKKNRKATPEVFLGGGEKDLEGG